MPSDITNQESLAHFLMGIPDYSETKADLTVVAERIVDITDICEGITPGMEQVVVKYGCLKRGMVAQFQHRPEPDVDGGTHMHFVYEGCGAYDLAVDESFQSRARIYGCGVATLAQVIIDFAPSNTQH